MAKIVKRGDSERRTIQGPWQCICHSCMSVVELLISDKVFSRDWYVCPACGVGIATTWVEQERNVVSGT